MSKYSFEFKLNVVLDYLSGETGGYKTLTKKYNIKSKTQIENWVNRYEQFGEEGLKRTKTKNLILENLAGCITT